MRKSFVVENNRKRNFKCDGEFSVEFRDGKVMVISQTPMFIDYGYEHNLEERIQKLVLEELDKFLMKGVSDLLKIEIEHAMINLLMDLKSKREIRSEDLPIVDVTGTLWLKRLEYLHTQAIINRNYSILPHIEEQVRKLNEERSNNNNIVVYFLDKNHDKIEDWNYYGRGW